MLKIRVLLLWCIVFVLPWTVLQGKDVTTREDAAGGCDGVKNGCWGFHTASKALNPWWQVDLGRDYPIARVVVFNRTDSNCAPRTRQLQVWVSGNKTPTKFTQVYQHKGGVFYGIREKAPLTIDFSRDNITARVIRLRVPGHCSFALDEVEVYSAEKPKVNIALGKPADQISVGPYSFRGPVSTYQRENIGPTLIVPKVADNAQIRDKFTRVEKLLQRMKTLDGSQKKLQACGQALAQLKAQWTATKQARPSAQPAAAKEKKTDYLAELQKLTRQVAFCNPLLDFDRLLFIKRHDARGVFHMCDQYYGFNAVPGGGLFMLEHPFSEQPKAVNLLARAVVQNGRLKGRNLEPGAFLSPELSFDGKTVLFAYTQAKGKNLEWTRESCYHIFRVNVDGTGLVQLTDGPWDDFDPCFLPNGRIAFVSERCGGFLRCGRHCPTYTLFSMDVNGRDIKPLSYHETHEWHPSVAHDGRLVFTRWDYIDRDTNVAHHIWTSLPDGSDPRSFHGNYPVKRESRPWMEMSIRAVPGSDKFVATAAAHHGHAFGSLVLIDQNGEDNGDMSQLTRLTPEVPFPESERHLRSIKACMVYGTPWPLSIDDYLCVYDAQARRRGIWWIDRFGNKACLYEDPSISCLSPIPVRPRPMPADVAQQGVKVDDNMGLVSVLNVYDSDSAWPDNARIAALRIIQVLPKTTPPPNKPRIGVANQTNARAILGTVPVESDGSAYFRMPAGMEVYFQALDARGFAIQSMRSGTHVHAGSHLSCQGCHEPKRRVHQQFAKMPMAFRRPPSEIRPEATGTRPFSFPVLVQPVLDAHCVDCHVKEKALDLRGIREGPHGWTRSYTNLAARYGVYFNVSNGSINDRKNGGSRTLPGQFGARVSPLLPYLSEKHHGVKLPREAYHRMVLWLDANSEFYGDYTEKFSRR